MPTDKGDRLCLDTIKRAAHQGALGLMCAVDTVEDKKVVLLCLKQEDEKTGEIVLTPLARMFSEDPYERYKPDWAEG